MKKITPPALVLVSSENPTETDPRAAAVERLVLHYLHAHGIRADLDTLMWHDPASAETALSREIAERVWRENSKLPLTLITVTLQELARRLRANELESLRSRLLGDRVAAGATEELTRFVALLAHENTTEDRLQYYCTVFRQLIWQVKRKLRSLPTHWDLMPVLVGPQAAGKSTAVARFAKPLSILYLADADFGLFTDDFRLTALHRYYLVCLDEMGKARSADLERVKQRITASTVQGRAMRSEQERRLTRNASFIGTSNHPLTETVSDPTGMRRFAEVLTREERWSREWSDKLSAIDFPLIWAVETGLDDTAPINAQQELAQRYQGELQSLSPFDYFLSECVEECDAEILTSLKDIYGRYVAFESLQGRRWASQQAFARMMESKFGLGVRPGNARHWRGLRLNLE